MISITENSSLSRQIGLMGVPYNCKILKLQEVKVCLLVLFIVYLHRYFNTH